MQASASKCTPAPPDAGEPSVVIEPSERLFELGLKELWQYRELLYFLAWRDVKVRYKQTAIGIAWVVVQPLLTIAMFTVVFDRFARMPSEGAPYPVFAFTALLPWNYFAQATARSAGSLVGDAHLIQKIYFPRLVMPLAAAIVPLVDLGIAFFALIGMLVWYGMTPTWGALAIPLFLGLAFATALSVGLWLAALNVRYRDVAHAIPFFVQFWMFVSPVVYPASLVPETWQRLYGLNPMAGVIEGFRWALLGKERPDLGLIGIGAAVVAILFFTGVLFFKRMEQTFADVI